MQQGSDWALTDRETGRILGSLGLSPDRRRAEGVLSLGYALARESWGRGLATEAARAALGYAFGPLHARLVTVYHFPFNHASRRVIEKCGFSYWKDILFRTRMGTEEPTRLYLLKNTEKGDIHV